MEERATGGPASRAAFHRKTPDLAWSAAVPAPAGPSARALLELGISAAWRGIRFLCVCVGEFFKDCSVAAWFSRCGKDLATREAYDTVGGVGSVPTSSPSPRPRARVRPVASGLVCLPFGIGGSA